MAAGLAFLTSLRSVSMPVSSRSMNIPRSETASSIAFCSRPAGSSQTTPRPQQDDRDQLTHDGGLADPLHGFAKQAANQKQHHDLRDEECLRWTHSGSLTAAQLLRPLHVCSASFAVSADKIRCEFASL